MQSFGNISLTGTNTFLSNAADKNVGDGLDGSAARNLTVSCGSSATMAGLDGGWRRNGAAPNNKVNLNSVFATGNAAGITQLDGGVLVVTRTCLFP